MLKKLVSASLIVPAIATLTSCKEAKQKTEEKLPNIIVVLADDLGYGDVSAYGSTTINTPNIDMLANNGVSFVNGYATSATSTPSRYALFTGKYPWKNEEAQILSGEDPLIIKETEFTLPKMLQELGYTTGAVGKWHLGMGDGNPDWNKTIKPGANQIGFDYSCLIAATNDRVPSVYVENGNVVGLDSSDPIEVSYSENFEGEPTAISNPELMKMEWDYDHNNSVVNGVPRIGFMKGGHSARWVDEDMADYFVDKVKTFIGANKDKPFFLYYGLHQPHVPRTPHSRFVGKTTMGPRGDAIIEADWCVGELIKNLEKDGLLENTIIIFSSDNGAVLNDGYKDQSNELIGDHNANGGLRGGKYSLFDGGAHVPFFVYWKGSIKPIVSSALISQLDILSSVAELVDYDKLPEGLDSENHLEVFLGQDTVARSKYFVEAGRRIGYYSNGYALIPPYNGGKRVKSGHELGNSQEYMLFNLDTDPQQKTDLVNVEVEVFEKMKKEFLEQTEGFYDIDIRKTLRPDIKAKK